MLFDSLIYFTVYNCIVKLHSQISEEYTSIKYSDDLLFHLLDNRLYPSACKVLVHYLSEKHLLNQYTSTVTNDELLNSILQFNEVEPSIKILCKCCEHDLIKSFKRLVDKRVDIPKYGLSLACKYGSFNIVKYIIEEYKNGDLKYDYIHNDSNCALMLSLCCNLGIAKYLISKGANIRDNNYKPLYYMFESDNDEVIKYIFEYHITDPSERREYIKRNYDIVVKWLLKINNEDMIKMMIEYGMEVNSDMFVWICQSGFINLVKYIVEEQKRFTYVNNYNLLNSCFITDNLKILKYLINHGACVSMLFESACRYGHVDGAKYILEQCLQNDRETRISNVRFI